MSLLLVEKMDMAVQQYIHKLHLYGDDCINMVMLELH